MKKSSAEHEKIDVVRRRGNAFAQLGLPDSDELLRKARVMNVINEVIAQRDLTQEVAAAATGLHQADISRIAHGHVGRFSLDRLLTVLDRLGVPIALEQHRDDQGNLVVEVRTLAHASHA